MGIIRDLNANGSTMNAALISILAVVLVSRLLQRYVNVPLPIGIMSLTLLVYSIFPDAINVHADEHFDNILILILPLILLPDAMHFKLKDLRKHALAIFYLSFVAVILSIIAGVLFNYTYSSEYSLTIGMLIALFAMVLATDAVSVTSIFSQFELPHTLKVLTEGESLFNDATAMIAFFFIAIPLINGVEITPVDISFVVLKVLVLSTLIGLVVGYIAKTILRWLHTTTDEFIVILIAAYAAFSIAELHAIHVSGILALIAAIMTLQYHINKQMRHFTDDDHMVDDKEPTIADTKMRLITTRARLQTNKNTIAFFAFFANGLLFVSMAELIKVDKLLEYSTEIIVLFLATTLIRALMMLKFSFISRQSKKLTSVNCRWWSVLTFSGIKGGLSIVMVHALPDDFIYKAMFEQIVMGVILLSIFVYSAALIVIISRYKEAFLEDIRQESLG